MLRKIALATLLASSFNAHATLTSYAPWDSAFGGSGLAGVQFNVQSAGGVTVALGAHGYKNGVTLPNNGADTFIGQNGIYVPDGLGRANWSFDFWVDAGTAGCAGCTAHLLVDTDPSAATSFVDLFAVLSGGPGFPLLGSNGDSWNMEMPFMAPALGYDFNPFAPSSTSFELFVTDAAGRRLVSSDITVNVPEPGSLALFGLALAGLGGLRRRRA